MVDHQPLREESFSELAVYINEGLRNHPDIKLGASITALISFVDLLKALNTLDGKVTASSVVTTALTVFPHRVRSKSLVSTEKVVKEVLARIFMEHSIKIDQNTLKLLEIPENNMNATRENNDVTSLPSVSNQDRETSISVDFEEMLRLFSNQKDTDPPILDVLLGLLSQNSHYGAKQRGGIMKVSLEFVERLKQLGILNEDLSQLDVHSVRLDHIDPEKLSEIQRLFQQHLDQLVRIGVDLTLQEGFSRERFQNLLQEVDKLLQLQSHGGRHEDLTTAFLFQKTNFPIINQLLQDLSKRRRKGEQYNEWLDHVYARENLKDFLELLKTAGQLEEKDGELRLTRESYHLIFEKLLPEIEAFLVLQKKPRLGQGEEEEIVDVRPFKSGDRYHDISTRATIKNLIRRFKKEPHRGDFVINQKEPRKPLDIILIVDSSMSMGSDGKLDEAKKAVIGLALAALSKGDRIGVVSFSDSAEEVIGLSENVEGSIEKILGLRPLESTNIEEALHLSARILSRDRSSNQKHVILVTDGEPTSYTLIGKENDFDAGKYGYYSPAFSRITALRKANYLRSRNISISTICITKYDFGERRFCEKLAMIGNGKTYNIHSGKSLLNATLKEYNRVQQLSYG